MELTPKQQAIELIKKSNKILVITHSNPDGDAIGSALALYLTLKKLDKEITVVSSDKVPEILRFLPQTESITRDFVGTRNFIISLDTSQTEVDKLSYNTEDNKLNIIITPKKGEFSSNNISFSKGMHKFDLIFVLDCTDLERLGVVYDQNTEMFFGTPIINIDHHGGNDYFGEVDLVDLTATSTSEILLSLIESLDIQLIDEDISTSLLTGIITDTGSFQNTNTTPKSLTIAAQLVASGGRQQEIIKNIYKTKPLSTLKLWGRVLYSIKSEPNLHLVWSKATLSDIKECKASSEEISGVIDELLTSAPNADIVLLFSERTPDVIFGSIRTTKAYDANKLASLFGGGGHARSAGFKLENTNLDLAEEKIINKIKEFQEKEKIEDKREQIQQENIQPEQNINNPFPENNKNNKKNIEVDKLIEKIKNQQKPKEER